MIVFVIEIVVALSVYLFFTKPQHGISIFSLIYFLVPSIGIVAIGGVALKWNYINAVLLIALLYHATRSKGNTLFFKPLYPFIVYYVLLLLLIPFEWATPIDYQISSWIGAVFRYLVFPVALCTFFKSGTKSQLCFLHYTICSIILVCCLYCLFLTQMRGFNPYLAIFNADMEHMELYFAAEDSGRIFGRISSVFAHPMNFGCFLTCSFFYCTYLLLVKHNRWVLLLLAFILLSALVCGVRSVLVAIFFGLAFFVLVNGKTKYIKYTIIFSLLFFVLMIQNDNVYDYISSIYDSSQADNVKGSNMEMRLRQLSGCFIEMKENPLFGKGYNWTIYYNQNYGNHPYCIAFESMIFVILCNWSVAGVLVWTWLLIRLYKTDYRYRKIRMDKSLILMSLTTAFVTYICLTGDYGYNMFWIFFYALIYIDMYHNYKQTKYGFESNRTLSTPVLSLPRER